ncbi:unnamed protein product [Acanthoscelides obtectus]|uniref:Uncharacterized protein n=1 Tax=Acanthoscelides obtectus TaxID=200917 RepID=A0A9P0JVQ8_ACAOB|nr:unnamed protein product [Acanthoscelides obtectus]CAK1623848.1 hypothetical protein AOBTE_LOCUS2214 [Acanthoscelides obtectus]
MACLLNGYIPVALKPLQILLICSIGLLVPSPCGVPPFPCIPL